MTYGQKLIFISASSTQADIKRKLNISDKDFKKYLLDKEKPPKNLKSKITNLYNKTNDIITQSNEKVNEKFEKKYQRIFESVGEQKRKKEIIPYSMSQQRAIRNPLNRYTYIARTTVLYTVDQTIHDQDERFNTSIKFKSKGQAEKYVLNQIKERQENSFINYPIELLKIEVIAVIERKIVK